MSRQRFAISCRLRLSTLVLTTFCHSFLCFAENRISLLGILWQSKSIPYAAGGNIILRALQTIPCCAAYPKLHRQRLLPPLWNDKDMPRFLRQHTELECLWRILNGCLYFLISRAIAARCRAHAWINSSSPASTTSSSPTAPT